MQNGNFNTKAASERLEQLAIERAAFRRAGVQLAELTRLKEWASLYKVYQSNTDSKTWHIVHKKDNIEMVDPKELEELVVSIQGIIWKQDLPPFVQEIRRPTQNRKRFLRQSVTLTGCGTPTFEQGLKTIMDVQALFDRHIPANKIDECTFIDKCDKHLGIHLTNRYFTPRWESPAEEAVPFTTDVDPSGILAALAGHDFFHGEQNIVKYHDRQIVQGGAVKYETISPVRFRVGDIVEAKATFMLVPIREGRFKLSAVLRSLTLLDTSFAQTSAQASNTIRKTVGAWYI
ncbi:hypothetical protein F5887DRAFT_1086610 [Amanita rubescens]|nr:hypothetical protein F5887DRAFT_1086610 [Amanita rubescens]